MRMTTPQLGNEEPIQPLPSLVDLAAAAIRERILRGTLRMGQKVSEARLAAELNISKTPIREAMRRLESEGLLQILPRRGTFIFSPTKQELIETSSYRACIEVGALEIAFTFARAELIERLNRVLHDMQMALDEHLIAEYQILDAEFHHVIINCCRNGYFSKAYDLIAAKVAAMRMRFSVDLEHLQLSLAQHREIVQNLEFGDLNAAVEVLNAHVKWREGKQLFWLLEAAAREGNRERKSSTEAKRALGAAQSKLARTEQTPTS